MQKLMSIEKMIENINGFGFRIRMDQTVGEASISTVHLYKESGGLQGRYSHKSMWNALAMAHDDASIDAARRTAAEAEDQDEDNSDTFKSLYQEFKHGYDVRCRELAEARTKIAKLEEQKTWLTGELDYLRGFKSSVEAIIDPHADKFRELQNAKATND